MNRSIAAQQRPLPIEQLDGVGSGNVAAEVGIDYARDVLFPLSGLEGNLWRFALIGLDVGLSDIADFEITGGLRDHLAITSKRPAVLSSALRLSNPSATGAFDDLMVATKIRLMADAANRPGFSVRVATRLPNAKHPSGLGQDTTDFFGSLIIGHTIAATHVVANIGLGILGDPLRGNRRVNSLLYGAGLDRAVATHLDVVANVEGRTGPLEPGLEPRAVGKAGVVWKRAPLRLEMDGTMGFTARDGGVGAALSAMFTFHAFHPERVSP